MKNTHKNAAEKVLSEELVELESAREALAKTRGELEGIAGELAALDEELSGAPDIEAGGLAQRFGEVNIRQAAFERLERQQCELVSILEQNVACARRGVTVGHALDLFGEAQLFDRKQLEQEFLEQVQPLYDEFLDRLYAQDDLVDELRPLVDVMVEHGVQASKGRDYVMVEGEYLSLGAGEAARPRWADEVFEGLVDKRHEAKMEVVRAEARKRDAERRADEERFRRERMIEVNAGGIPVTEFPGGGRPSVHPQFIGSSYDDMRRAR
ncbi:hypothetical protein [Brevibacterium luteolum]|uniref:hypothetical protein n=1 Tax=Brevibacterium luteolum TaxID=199591 RepID=UPI00223C46AC|nr:hypothetical protein [Brevibacterium luteolum]MCT1658208.1 hypothetical protein [Brevibacterium luteolum]MCT1920932.1 hypothetical protein [Brevibacterium luteolum]